MALELRPNCEFCDVDLPPNSVDAWICSYECTFCSDCVEHKLHNVCPNCGGGFAPRPIRPATECGRVSRSPGVRHQPNALTCRTASTTLPGTRLGSGTSRPRIDKERTARAVLKRHIEPPYAWQR